MWSFWIFWNYLVEIEKTGFGLTVSWGNEGEWISSDKSGHKDN